MSNLTFDSCPAVDAAVGSVASLRCGDRVVEKFGNKVSFTCQFQRLPLLGPVVLQRLGTWAKGSRRNGAKAGQKWN
jgi:hypothetical protein